MTDDKIPGSDKKKDDGDHPILLILMAIPFIAGAYFVVWPFLKMIFIPFFLVINTLVGLGRTW